jgi:hypothetical protein
VAEAVIDRWASQFGLDAEALLDDLHGEDNPDRGTKRSGPGRRGVPGTGGPRQSAHNSHPAAAGA